MRDWILRCFHLVVSECTAAARIATGDQEFLPSQIALAIGVAYLFVPIDLIPDRTPMIGHLDEISFLLGGFVAARKLAPVAQPARPRLMSRPPALHASAPIIPNFFIVGAARCGTTSLFAAMDGHPDVFCCPVKEPNHFATDRNAKPAVMASAARRGALLTIGSAGLQVLPRVATTPDFETYTSLFNGWAGERAVGEASTSYLISKTAAAEIAERQPDARIIIVLRQPAQRAQSEYLMHAQMGRTMGGIDSTVAVLGDPEGESPILSSEIIAASLYAPQIARYLDVFRQEQVLFLRFDDLVNAPVDSLRRVLRHVGVDPDAAAVLGLSHQNQSRSLRFSRLNRLLFRSGLRDVLLHTLPKSVRQGMAKRYYASPPHVRSQLPFDLFRADVAETERLTGLDLSAWDQD